MTTTRELFRRHSLRCTSQRMAVYECLRETDAHPTAEELYRLVRDRIDKLSLATVYNALDALCEARLIRQMPTTNGTSRYDADLRPHAHVFLRCPQTDIERIADVPMDLSDELVQKLPADVLARIEQALGIQIDGVSVRIIARHPDCPEADGDPS